MSGGLARWRSEAGFSLIELLIVVGIIGVLANIAVATVFDATLKADAAHVTTDADMIRTAVARYAVDNGANPKTAGWSKVPKGLASYLPEGLSFDYKDVDYRFIASRKKTAGLMVRVPKKQLALMAKIRDAFGETGIPLGKNRVWVPFDKTRK